MYEILIRSKEKGSGSNYVYDTGTGGLVKKDFTYDREAHLDKTKGFALLVGIGYKIPLRNAFIVIKQDVKISLYNMAGGNSKLNNSFFRFAMNYNFGGRKR